MWKQEYNNCLAMLLRVVMLLFRLFRLDRHGLTRGYADANADLVFGGLVQLLTLGNHIEPGLHRIHRGVLQADVERGPAPTIAMHVIGNRPVKPDPLSRAGFKIVGTIAQRNPSPVIGTTS